MHSTIPLPFQFAITTLAAHFKALANFLDERPAES